MLQNSKYQLKSINMKQCPLFKGKLLKLFIGLKDKVVGNPRRPLIITTNTFAVGNTNNSYHCS